MCLAKSSTSNRRERIAYRELVLERLRLVPKGHWILAGGANHRFVVKIESEPRPGLRKSHDDHSVAPAGARRIFLVGTGGLHHRLISVTPPALVIDAVPKLQSKSRHICPPSYLYKTVSEIFDLKR